MINIESTNSSVKELSIGCSCMGDCFMRMINFQEEKDLDEVYINIVGHEICGFKNKLKVIWNIIRHGEFENNGILVNSEDKIKVRNFFNGIIINK